MNSYLKKGFMLGLGIAAVSKEKAEKYVNDLMVKGEIAPQEAKELLKSIVDKGEATGQKLSEDMKAEARAAVKELGFVTDEEFNELKLQIVELEAAVAELKLLKQNDTKTDTNIDTNTEI